MCLVQPFLVAARAAVKKLYGPKSDLEGLYARLTIAAKGNYAATMEMRSQCEKSVETISEFIKKCLEEIADFEVWKADEVTKV